MRLIGCGGTNQGKQALPAPARDVQLDLGPEHLTDTVEMPDGRLAISHSGLGCVMAFEPLTGELTCLTGAWKTVGPSATRVPTADARYDRPSGLALDSAGDILIVDQGNNAIRKLCADGRVVTLVGRDGVLAFGPIAAPLSVVEGANGVLWFGEDSTGTTRLRRAFPGMVRTLSFAGRAGGVAGIACHPVLGTLIATRARDDSSCYIGRVLPDEATMEDQFWKPWDYPLGGIGRGVDGAVYVVGASGQILRLQDDGTASHVVGCRSMSMCEEYKAPFIDGLPEDKPGFPAPGPAGSIRVFVDEAGVVYVAGRSYVYKWVPVATLSKDRPFLVYPQYVDVSPDKSALNMLCKQLGNPTLLGTDPGCSAESLRTFIGDRNLWLMGSSYSNTSAHLLEGGTKEHGLRALRELFRAMDGVYRVDFQERGGGDGTAYGAAAPRIRCTNTFGSFLIERWLDNGEVNDYGVILKAASGKGSLTYVAGIRDISTKAAAYVAANSRLDDYFKVLSVTNALLVHVKYPPSEKDVNSFMPGPTNCRVMPLSAVESARPIAP
jgi:hypothetical protein